MGKKKVAVGVVCDTNVVVSALLFAGGQLSWLRRFWRNGTIVPLLAEAPVRELMTVLAYPKFRLTADDIEALLAGYLPYGESINPLLPQPGAPHCRDKSDQIFIDLALAGQADYLVTGDADLLDLDGQFSCAVVRPAVLRERLEGN